MKRLIAPLTRHPLLTTFGLTTLIAIGHAIAIFHHRQLGAIDPDESGYLAAALRFQRSIDFGHPKALYLAIKQDATAPLVPSLSVILLILGTRDVLTAMAIQPILMVISCVAITGITRRWAGPLVAIAAGTSFALTPTVVMAAKSYWLGLGAATALICALWALVVSDGGRNRWIWAYGAGVGAMMLSRTMMLGMLPGVVLAGVIVCWGTRRTILRFVGAIAIAVAVAGPWWWETWRYTLGYLTSYGYGKRAGLFGEGGPLDRIQFRLQQITDGIGTRVPFFFVATAIVAAVLLLGLVIPALRKRLWAFRPKVNAAQRTRLAVLVAMLAGFAALVSTKNNGAWFELPVTAALFPLAWSLVGRGPLMGKIVAATPFALFAAVVLPYAWWIEVPIPLLNPDGSSTHFPEHYEVGFAEYDKRFAPDRRADHKAAAAEWWATAQQVERELRSIVDEKPNVIFNMSGNFQLLNANTLFLASELHLWQPTIWIPDTTVSNTKVDEQLTSVATDSEGNVVEPRPGATFERVLILEEHRYHLFTPDADVAKFAKRARRLGWVDVARVDMPSGGHVSILRFPEK